MTDDEIKHECECKFQAGYPKTFLITTEASGRLLFRGMDNVPHAQRHWRTGNRIFARRKVYRERRYEWKEIE